MLLLLINRQSWPVSYWQMAYIWGGGGGLSLKEFLFHIMQNWPSQDVVYVTVALCPKVYSKHKHIYHILNLPPSNDDWDWLKEKQINLSTNEAAQFKSTYYIIKRSIVRSFVSAEIMENAMTWPFSLPPPLSLHCCVSAQACTVELFNWNNIWNGYRYQYCRHTDNKILHHQNYVWLVFWLVMTWHGMSYHVIVFYWSRHNSSFMQCKWRN